MSGHTLHSALGIPIGSDAPKPKSSRNSSIESFVVCRNYSPPADFIPSMDTFLLDHSYSSGSNEVTGGPSSVIVPFVACGTLSGFDSDKSYPLELGSEGGEESVPYTFRSPVQPPIRPNYHSALQRSHGEVDESGAAAGMAAISETGVEIIDGNSSSKR